jgi:hypothetical protein
MFHNDSCGYNELIIDQGEKEREQYSRRIANTNVDSSPRAFLPPWPSSPRVFFPQGFRCEQDMRLLDYRLMTMKGLDIEYRIIALRSQTPHHPLENVLYMPLILPISTAPIPPPVRHYDSSVRQS